MSLGPFPRSPPIGRACHVPNRPPAYPSQLDSLTGRCFACLIAASAAAAEPSGAPRSTGVQDARSPEWAKTSAIRSHTPGGGAAADEPSALTGRRSSRSSKAARPTWRRTTPAPVGLMGSDATLPALARLLPDRPDVVRGPVRPGGHRRPGRQKALAEMLGKTRAGRRWA